MNFKEYLTEQKAPDVTIETDEWKAIRTKYRDDMKKASRTTVISKNRLEHGTTPEGELIQAQYHNDFIKNAKKIIARLKKIDGFELKESIKPHIAKGTFYGEPIVLQIATDLTNIYVTAQFSTSDFVRHANGGCIKGTTYKQFYDSLIKEFKKQTE